MFDSGISSSKPINWNTAIYYRDVDKIAKDGSAVKLLKGEPFEWLFAFNGNVAGFGYVGTLEEARRDLVEFIEETLDSFRKLSVGTPEVNGWTLKLITKEDVEREKQKLHELGKSTAEIHIRVEVSKKVGFNRVPIYMAYVDTDEQLEKEATEYIDFSTKRLAGYLKNKKEEWQIK